MERKINFGVIGSGIYGKLHASIYKTDPRTELKSIWSPTKSHREEAANKFSCKAVENWKEIIEDPSIDCVAIASPDFAHTEYAVSTLRGGKHVILEKPMAMSSKECEEIISARDCSGKKLMINHQNRWYPAFCTGQKAISSGKIGKPVYGNFVLSNTVSWVEGNVKWIDKSGPEWYLMIHIVDLAFWMLGDKPKEVIAMMQEGFLKSKGFFTRDVVKATIKMVSGAVIHFESSMVLPNKWRNPVLSCCASVQGESGSVEMNGDSENFFITTDNYQTPLILSELTTDTLPIYEFIKCITEDKPVPVSGEDGLLAVKAIEAIIKSYTEKRVVDIDLI